MDDDHRELANWLFATATAMLEEAAGTAAAGQSPRNDALQLIELGRRLQTAARDVAVIAEAAAIIAQRGAETSLGGPKSSA